MEQFTIEEIRSFNHENLRTEILNTKKILFDFRLKKATRQNIKPHIIQRYKQQLARLMTIEQEKFISQ